MGWAHLGGCAGKTERDSMTVKKSAKRNGRNRELEKQRAPARNKEKETAMSRILASMSREEFAEAVEMASAADPENTRLDTFLRALVDPAYRSVSIKNLTRQFGISLLQVHDIWRESRMHHGMMRMLNHVPDILEDTAVDARSTMGVCPRCDGIGTVMPETTAKDEVPSVRSCPECEGKQKVRRPGDKVARELVFESIGLTGKRGGPLVAIQNNMATESGLEEVLVSTQKLIMGEPKNDE
jgi:hypothetical protein